MKKVFFISLFVIGAFLASTAQSYPPDNGYPPQSYPNGQYSQNYPNDQYYYYPDANVYYYPVNNNYIYYDQNRWCSSSNVPRYLGWNNRMPSVVINYRGGSIWNQNNDHRRMYNSRHNNQVVVRAEVNYNARGYRNRGYDRDYGDRGYGRGYRDRGYDRDYRDRGYDRGQGGYDNRRRH